MSHCTGFIPAHAAVHIDAALVHDRPAPKIIAIGALKLLLKRPGGSSHARYSVPLWD
jgi:hypothetical protein